MHATEGEVSPHQQPRKGAETAARQTTHDDEDATSEHEDTSIEENADRDVEKGGEIRHNIDVEKSASDSAATDSTASPIEKTRSRSSKRSNNGTGLSTPRLIAMVFTLTGAAFLNTLATTAVVIILPTISKALAIPPARQQWLISAYSLTFGCFLLMWGRLADVHGRRGIFLLGSAALCVAQIVTPFLSDEIGFDVFRGLQGLAAAANVPTAIGILGATFAEPGKAKNYAFATYSAGAPMGSVFGVILGGLVAQYTDWRWAFWILAILAALVTVAGHFVIPRPSPQAPKVKAKNAVDWIGGALITVGLVVLLFALTEGNIVGWSTAWIPVLIVVSVLLIACFVVWQLYLEKRTARRPLIKVTIFRNLRVSAAMLTMGLCFGSFNNYLVFSTYYYQDYQGLSAIETTLRFIPLGVCGVLTVVVTSQLLARVKVNYILMFGLLCCTISNLLFAVPIPPSTTYWAYGMPAMCLAVFGADTLFPSLLLFTAQSLPKEDQAIGGAMINAVGQVGRAIALAIATAIQTAVQESKSPAGRVLQGSGSVNSSAFLSGLRAAEWFSVSIALLAFGLASIAFRGAGKVGATKK